jgi:hypothetical protein
MYIHRLSNPSAARGISTRTWERVDNETVEHRFAITEVSTGREEDRLTKSTVLFMRS